MQISDEARSHIGEWIKLEREGRGWSQRDLGDAVHATRGTVNRWEQGHYMPTNDSIERLVEVLPGLGQRIETAAEKGSSVTPLQHGDLVVITDADGEVRARVRLVVETNPIRLDVDTPKSP